MAMFHRVEPQHAGLTALGVLVPQGAKTLVIVRPRALEWDLLPARWDGDSEHAPEFCAFGRDEAAGAARRLVQALEAAVAQGINPLQTCGAAAGTSFQIWVRTDEFVWIACRRTPGQAYQPAIFATLEEATHAAEKISAVVWPAADVKQEYYFNTQNFS
jgi:hypothetical protein